MLPSLSSASFGTENKYDPKCEAQFPDLGATSSPPPDLQPMMRKLTVIQAAKE
jgi:hypothetical protein